MRAEALANLARVISTGRRAGILRILIDSNEPVASSTIATILGIRDGDASYNLIKLAEVGLIIRQPSGRWVFYSPNRSLISEIQKFFDPPATIPVADVLARGQGVVENPQ